MRADDSYSKKILFNYYIMQTSTKSTLKDIIIPAVIIGTVITGAALASHGQGNRQGLNQTSKYTTSTFSEAEKLRLVYGQQEERLAGDVYSAMFEKWGIETFDKISQSEERHTNSMGTLLEKAGLPQTTGYGELQATYDALIASGNESLENAINVGITIEILDIKDIDETVAETTNADILKVYEKLRKGSINHLNAYVAQLQKNNFSTDLNWEQYTTQEQVSEKLECLNLSPEEREKKESEKTHGNKQQVQEIYPELDLPDNWKDLSFEEKEEYLEENGYEIPSDSEKHKNKKNKKNKNSKNSENSENKNYNDKNHENSQKMNKNEKSQKDFTKKAKKGNKFKKFDKQLKEKKTFGDDSKIKRKNAVTFLQQRGILNGYEDGEFKPEKSINRAESIKVLLEAIGENPEENNVLSADFTDGKIFEDVSLSDWFAGYVSKAKKQGIIKGYSDNSFRPAKTVNQAELLKIAFNTFGIDLTDYPITTVDTSLWFAPYLQYAIDNNLLDQESVNPAEGMTREEFSEVIYRLILQQEAL